MTMRWIAIAAMLAALGASGCSKANQPASSSGAAPIDGSSSAAEPGAMPQASGSDADAIRSAIEEHVRNDHSINMDVMEMSVDSVSVNGDQAHAEAAFRLKQGGTGMAMTYFLARQSAGWVVTRSQPSDGQFVHPPTDGSHSGMAPNSGDSGMPDVTDFFKNHPPVSKN
ncbi:MAG TPA: hypothetical protein VMD78_15690 [Candidatus Baltobacteraceae bacterium]|nr:hypothetical protein [Candidatus Baltobacteraceae bacterium]